MSRSTQDFGFGLNNPIDQEELSYLDRQQYGQEGMFDEIPVYEYSWSGKVLYREITQYSPWSSGPMLFRAYKRLSDGKLFSYWTPNDANSECGEMAVSDELDEVSW